MHDVVHVAEVGVEPTYPKASDLESDAYTSFATRPGMERDRATSAPLHENYSVSAFAWMLSSALRSCPGGTMANVWFPFSAISWMVVMYNQVR